MTPHIFPHSPVTSILFDAQHLIPNVAKKLVNVERSARKKS